MNQRTYGRNRTRAKGRTTHPILAVGGHQELPVGAPAYPPHKGILAIIEGLANRRFHVPSAADAPDLSETTKTRATLRNGEKTQAVARSNRSRPLDS